MTLVVFLLFMFLQRTNVVMAIQFKPEWRDYLHSLSVSFNKCPHAPYAISPSISTDDDSNVEVTSLFDLLEVIIWDPVVQFLVLFTQADSLVCVRAGKMDLLNTIIQCAYTCKQNILMLQRTLHYIF